MTHFKAHGRIDIHGYPRNLRQPYFNDAIKIIERSQISTHQLATFVSQRSFSENLLLVDGDSKAVNLCFLQVDAVSADNDTALRVSRRKY